MSDTIYLVCGDVGEYSDRWTWIVAWYPTEDEAKAHVAALDADNAATLVALKALDDEWDYEDRAKVMATPLDPNRGDAYGGLPSYSVATIERGKWPFPLPPRGEVKA